MKPRQAFLFATISLALGTLPVNGEVRIGYGRAAQLARASDIPGKNVPGQCFQFAQALHARFRAAGIRSKIITYGYEPDVMPFAGVCPSSPATPRCHAVVAYDDEGRTYIMDNQCWAPVWVRDASAIEMMQRFSGLDVAVRSARVVPDADSPMTAASGSLRPVRAQRDRRFSRKMDKYFTLR
jgi:hypothetical protein